MQCAMSSRALVNFNATAHKQNETSNMLLDKAVQTLVAFWMV